EHPLEDEYPGTEQQDEDGPLRERVAEEVDGLAHAVIPALGIAHREDDLRPGVLREQLAIEHAAGHIDGRPEAGEETVPIDRLAASSGIPGPCLVHARDHLERVVTPGEPQLLQ